jgi:translocator assembly and maintenance protein 41
MTDHNSNDDGQLTSQSALAKIVEQFPQEHLVHAFGYGSGVFSQTLGQGKKHEGMLDMIFVVDDAYEFHKSNAQVFPHHYATWLRYSGLAPRLQRHFPLKDAHVLFHVVDDPVPMKYGVVHIDDLLRDLNDWESLYLAGRLHKPTLPILSNIPDELLDAQQRNLQAAVAAALLLLPAAAAEEESDATTTSIAWSSFYSEIAALSYTGDFRMQVGGEDPQKISKLVTAPGQLERFQSLYQEPILKPLEQAGVLSRTASKLEWNPRDTSARAYLTQQLPVRVRTHADTNGDHLAKALASIVAPAARHQSLKGIFTLGFRRSIQYASAKLSKGLLRRKN